MHFRYISAKIQLENLKQHFDWGGPGIPSGYALVFAKITLVASCQDIEKCHE